MKGFFIVICCFVTAVISAQRDTREIIDAKNIGSITINTNEVYLINITTSKTSQIIITTHSEGEYYDDIVLESSITNGELIINTSYPKILSSGYDKLSAHKVFSLEIALKIPENIIVNVSSNIASLQGRGAFKSFFAELKQGYCKLLNFTGAAVINTYSGNILVETSSGSIEANTRNGILEIPDFLTGQNPLKLTSIDGDIKVRKN